MPTTLSRVRKVIYTTNTIEASTTSCARSPKPDRCAPARHRHTPERLKTHL